MNTEGIDARYAQFKSWMSEFQIASNDELVTQRWSALKKLCEDVDYEDIETLVRLALKTRQAPTAPAIAKIVAFFQQDSSFSATGNARELEVLSGAALLEIANSAANQLSSEAALSVLTSLVGGARKANLPFNLLDLATAAVEALSRGAGRRLAAPTVKASPRVSLGAGAKAIQENNWVNASSELTASGTAIDSAIQQLTDQIATVTKNLARTLSQQDEELQMLWWLIGGRSEDLNVTFDAVTGDKQALILAKELADHTTLPPGPASISALLSKAGLKTRGKVAVAGAIAACEQSWLAPLVDGLDISPIVHPIHFGIERQLEVGQGTDWVANWAAVTGLKSDLELPPVVLGMLFYRERLLLKAD